METTFGVCVGGGKVRVEYWNDGQTQSISNDVLFSVILYHRIFVFDRINLVAKPRTIKPDPNGKESTQVNMHTRSTPGVISVNSTTSVDSGEGCT